MADEPVSRILCNAPSRKGRHAAAIIPLGHDSRRDSSSLPEGCSQRWIAPSSEGKRSLQRPPRSGRLRKRSRRAGPALPSYLALHHAGFSVPPMLPPERWALTPPFHPCQTERAFRRRLAGFPARCHRASPAGGIFSVALSVSDRCSAGLRARHLQRHPLALPGALPFTLSLQSRRRVYPEARRPRISSSPALASLRRRCPDFPPATPA